MAVGYLTFPPEHLWGFVVANSLVAVPYGFLVALLFGRLGGAYLMLFIPMIDVGIFQDPMFISGEQAAWMKFFPGFGGTRFAVDAPFSSSADDWTALAAAAAWLAALGLVTIGAVARLACT